jgi:ATP-dependent Clp protease ATP-binding subunit ClpC
VFERYTENARRVIFFARYEASQFGSPYIETEHLLLGLLRQDKALADRILRSHSSVEIIRKQIEAHTLIREKTSTNVDLPLTNECKRVLAYAAEEAERLGEKHIGSEHLLLGMLREEKSFAAALLRERGVKLVSVREELAKMLEPSPQRSRAEPSPVLDLFQDLTAAAGEFEPFVGREAEIDAVSEILARRHHKSAILIGEHGVGKTTIVEGLARRIADGDAPSCLANKRILGFDPALIAAWVKERRGLDTLPGFVKGIEGPPEAVLFLYGLQPLLAPGFQSSPADSAAIVRYALVHGGVQCIAAATPADYRQATEAFPWLAECFRAVHVRPLDEEETLQALTARKGELEKFHEVTYSDDALEFAARSASSYLSMGHLPGKAIELLDAAGAHARLHLPALPEEVADCQKRVTLGARRLESAIANHEFEKARLYSDEERKERENLKALKEKHHLDDSSSAVVGRTEVEEMIARWAAYPFSV